MKVKTPQRGWDMRFEPEQDHKLYICFINHEGVQQAWNIEWLEITEEHDTKREEENEVNELVRRGFLTQHDIIYWGEAKALERAREKRDKKDATINNK